MSYMDSSIMHNRSTSKASKERRDLINKEIDELRELLPLTKSTKSHLSYIQVMSAVCAYIRRGNYFNQISYQDAIFGETSFGFHEALPGFLIMVSSDNKLLFVSENIADYLGHSMVELLSKGAFLSDLVDEEDLHLIWNQIQQPIIYGGYHDVMAPKYNERRFVCRMLRSQCFKRRLPECINDQPEHRTTPVYVRGKVHPVSAHDTSQTVLLAICNPLQDPSNPASFDSENSNFSGFTSIHDINLRIKAISDSVKFILGYTENQLINCSWYQLVHHEDLQDATSLHYRVRSGCGQCSSVLRMLTNDGHVISVRAVADLTQEEDMGTYSPAIQLTHRVLSDEEADYYRAYQQQ